MRESVPFDVRPSGLRSAFVALSMAWAAILLFAPWIAGRAAVTSASTAFVIAVYGIGSFICHQLPARSFRLFAVQMPVCARCTGIYFGAAIAAVVAATMGDVRSVHRQADHRTVRPKPDPTHDRATSDRGRQQLWLMLGAAAVPSALTLVAEWTTGVMPSNIVRCAAGLPLGAAIAWAVVGGRSAGDFGVRVGPRG